LSFAERKKSPKGEVMRHMTSEEDSKGSMKEEEAARLADATRLPTAERRTEESVTREDGIATAVLHAERFWKR
jgi:hypothetical protein